MLIKKKPICTQCLVILLVFTLLFLGTSSQVVYGNQSDISLNFDSITLKTGETGTVIITAKNIPEPGLAGYRLKFYFDPRKIEIQSINKGGMSLAPAFNIDAELGVATIVSAQAQGIHGEPVLANIQIKALSSTDTTTEVQLEPIDLIDENLEKYTAAKVYGTLTILGELPNQISPSSPSQGSLPPTKAQKGTINSTQVVRAGLDRFGTSEIIALAHYPSGSTKNIVLANGYASADALAGAPLAYKLKAPIILAPKDPQDAKSLTNYLSKANIKEGNLFILGGAGVLNENYQKTDSTLAKTSRLGGENRRETAIQIAKEILGDSKGTPIVLVNESSFVDAISIAPIAAQKGWPILLTEKGRLSQETAKYLQEIKPEIITVIGGEGVISNQVMTELQGSFTKVNRIGGANRFDTNANVLKTFVSEAITVAFANGDSKDVVDALAGAGLGIPIVLVEKKDDLQESQLEWLQTVLPVTSEIFGGAGVISPSISW